MGRPPLIVKVDPAWDEERLSKALQPVINVLMQGGIAVYPTDTVYGVGGRIDHQDALEKVAMAKQRGVSPFPILVASVEDAERIAVFNQRARRLAEAFWPGPLTIKLRPRFTPHPRLVDSQGKMALRVPDHPVPRILARGVGGAIVGTSANKSGSPPPSSLEEALVQIGERVDAAVEGGLARHGVASTIVDVTVSPPVVVRVGAVLPRDLEEALGEEVRVSGKP